MKLLLTSNGITNKSLARSLRKLLGKPFDKANLVFIPTAANISPRTKVWLIRDLENLRALGFKEIDIINIDATPQEKIWRPRIERADIIFFGGGNSFYLMYWIKKSGLAKALPQLLKKRIYAGISAGSIVACPNLSLSSKKNRDLFKMYHGESYAQLKDEKALGFVDLYVRPHLNAPKFPQANEAYLKKMAKDVKAPVYGLADGVALEVIDGKVTVVGKGDRIVLNKKTS